MKNPIERGRISNHGRGLGTVTEEMVRERAREIAMINGRSQHNVLENDLLQALRELTGDEQLNPTPTQAETLTEEERWEPVPESIGHKAPTMPAPDEQTMNEGMVEEGIADAEHEQEVEATRESLRRDRDE